MAIIRDPKELRKMWAAEERKKRKEAAIEAAKATDTAYDGPASADEAEAKSDWEKLVNIAKIKFPEHMAAKFKLRPNERVACIAYITGWPVEKIALAASVTTQTVYTWINKDEAQEFVKAFKYHSGAIDSKEAIDNEVYQSLRTICEIRDDPMISAPTRLEAAKWLWEQKYGKAKESREVKSINLRDLTEQLSKQQLEEANKDDLLDEAN